MKSIEQKYKKLDDIEHCLLRPGMYVGSTKTRKEVMNLIDEDDVFSEREVSVNPAFIKIFDEIISNAADEHRRNKKLDLIEVITDAETGEITVSDNGGIPVILHSEHNEYIPEMIFSNLKAGSNFDDTENRIVAGTNGVGATLTNIFSSKFAIETCDKKKLYTQEFRNNMRARSEPKVIKSKSSKGYTKISYIADFNQFGLSGLDDDHIEIMRKRCIDLAACNPCLTVRFNGTKYRYSTFNSYCRLYIDDIVYEASDRWRIGVGSSSGSLKQISFVNSVETKDGGTHVDAVLSQIIAEVRKKLKKKHKVDLKPAEIKNHIFVFVSADIVNSSFSSQTKEKLITDPRDFGSKHTLSDKFLKSVCESEMIQNILDWAIQKKDADERKELRKLNKKLGKEKVQNLIDAKGKDRESCTLALFEGKSALAAFRKFRNPMIQGSFPLRGKFLNIADMPSSKIIKNKEVLSLLKATGLRLGEDAENLRYGKILIYSDADPDGDSIAGLLTNFFGRFWPDLLKDNKLFRVMTPLVVVKKKDKKLLFYTDEEFVEWKSAEDNIKSWDISYKKGLASLADEEYEEIIRNPEMFALIPGDNLRQSLDNWFGSDPAVRKQKILNK